MMNVKESIQQNENAGALLDAIHDGKVILPPDLECDVGDAMIFLALLVFNDAERLIAEWKEEHGG